MPSKKRKYNARFPAGRIKKIMQTDEEVGKVAQAVPIIISRTLELFVESLLSKAMQVTMARNAKTLSPSHVKQCIQSESRFDFLRDLVKNIPDVSAAEEKEMMSAENSPNSSRFAETTQPRRVAREDSTSSSSSEVRQALRDAITAKIDSEPKPPRTETITSTITSNSLDLSRRTENEKPRANFYHETLILDDVSPKSVITLNPTYSTPQPSTSYSNFSIEAPNLHMALQKPNLHYSQKVSSPIPTPKTPVTPILNIDFTKNLTNPEIKVLDTTAANIVGVKNEKKSLSRQNSKSNKNEMKIKQTISQPVNLDIYNSGNLQIDEDYDT